MKYQNLLASIAVAVVLTACGGGGGGSTSTTAPAVTPPVAALPSDLQTSVPAATYAASSQELAFFSTLNDFRSKLGLGLLAQNAKLDTAAQNHIKYLASNTDVDFAAIDPASGRPRFHIEEGARPNFTGVTELDRANFAGYGGLYAGETGAYGLGAGSVKALNDLIATVYHRGGLMFQFPRDIGLAVGSDANQTMVILFGYQSKQQANANDYFGTYPAAGQTSVPRVAYIETPNPFTDVAYADFGTKTSFPINVVSAQGTTLAVNAFTVTEAGQFAPLDVRLLTKDTDPNKQLQANTAFIVGKAPFKANTTYNVAFSGTVNGVSTAKTWSFTTGS